MTDLGHLFTNPIALLAAAVGVIWFARVLANMAFRVVLILAAVGAFAVAGGAHLPAGMDVASLVTGLQAGFVETISTAGTLMRQMEGGEPSARNGGDGATGRRPGG